MKFLKIILIMGVFLGCEISAEEAGFAVIYRGYIKPGCEDDYQRAWQKIAEYFVTYRGAIGSCLHRASDGMWIAYSRWPDQKTRDAAWSDDSIGKLPHEIQEAVATLKNSLDADRKLPEIGMEVVNDMLKSNKPGMHMPFVIQPFETKYQAEVIEMIERIQVGEFSIPIVAAQRQELQSIARSFQKNKGNYWVALLDSRVIGTIAVIDIGHHAFELRDVFLDKEYRGSRTGYAKKLLDVALAWAKEHDVHTIYLGTTLAFKAAHRFYEKHGFQEIARKDMPSYCQPMDCDEKFYRFDLKF